MSSIMSIASCFVTAPAASSVLRFYLYAYARIEPHAIEIESVRLERGKA
jgi:hypothetical protein